MPSRQRYISSSDDDDESSTSDSSCSTSSSEYRSKHRKRKKKKKKSKHSKKKDRKRHKKRKKHSKSKHEKKSKKSRRKENTHRHSKKRHYTSDSASNATNAYEPKQKKRKLHHTKDSKDPCTPLSEQEMINNAKTVLSMFCENDTIKQDMRDIFNQLDHNQSVCIARQNLSYQQPLKMIFTFLSLATEDEITYTKSINHRTLTDLFINELKLSPNPSFIGPTAAPSHYKQHKITETINGPSSSDIVGVTMPTEADLLNNSYSSEEDEDVYGPTVMDKNDNNSDQKRLLQMEHSKIYAEMNRKIKGDDAGADNNEKREEWMTSMPSSLLSGSDFDKGTKNRTFNTNEHKIDNTWTQTPDDVKRQEIERKRIQNIQKQTNEKLKLFGLPSVEQHTIAENKRNDEEREGMEAMYSGVKRKSLFEEHQEKLMKEYKEELKEWKQRKKLGEKVGQKPVFKGVKAKDANASYTGSMDSYYDAQNPTFTRSKLNTFVHGGTIEDY
eukprot:99938_1